LAHRIHPSSKHEIQYDEATKIMLDKQFADLPEEFKQKIDIGNTTYEAIPSSECPSGLRGRIALFEMFYVDKEMQNIILKKPQEQEIYKLARTKGMLSMKEDAIIKAKKGLIPFKDIYNY
jgi:type II secretory ATPase GspE/PulE/Tfp pilus assembly ATPase PilB-like protein